MPKKLHDFFDEDMLQVVEFERVMLDCTAPIRTYRTDAIMPALAYDDSNIFARILRGELPCTKVLETDSVLAFMDIMPRADGHVLVLPKVPARTLLDIDQGSLGELIIEVQRIARAVKQALAADGITIWQFNESAGGQEVFHLHFHILPRWQGVELRPRTGAMEKPEVLEALAQKIAAALEPRG